MWLLNVTWPLKWFVPLFKYYSHLFMGHTHTLIFCCLLPRYKAVKLLHKKLCGDREIGVWCFWQLHLFTSFYGFFSFFEKPLFFFKSVIFSAFSVTWFHLIMAPLHLSTVWPNQESGSPGQVICVAVYWKSQKGFVTSEAMGPCVIRFFFYFSANWLLPCFISLYVTLTFQLSC